MVGDIDSQGDGPDRPLRAGQIEHNHEVGRLNTGVVGTTFRDSESVAVAR
jgi:hypothetical protein